MTSPWTQDRVLSLAPDSASAAAGQGLAALKKWQAVGRSERAVWGLCQGSGKDPYQARIDLAEPAFKCSCPSRKFPCKHGLGLLFLFAKDEKVFKAGVEPGWVSEWIDGRADRAEKKEQKAKEAASKPVDVEAQAKRAAARDSRVADGVAECRVWLEDLIRRGLAAARQESESFWERTAARMVDAQAPGLARLIRQIPASIASGQEWHRRTLDRLGRIHLLLRAAERLETLPADLVADVRVALGRTQAKEEALGAEGIADRWCVAAQVTEEEERLRVRRSWLLGRKTGKRALVLDFAAGSQPMDTALVAGAEFDAEVAYYPARLPLRALVKARTSAAHVLEAAACDGAIDPELRAYTEALAVMPWLERWPVMMTGVPAMRGNQWFAVDSTGRGLPMRPGFGGVWKLLALSGGRPLTLMGEWDGEFLTPLSAWGAGLPFEDLAPRWSA